MKKQHGIVWLPFLIIIATLVVAGAVTYAVIQMNNEKSENANTITNTVVVNRSNVNSVANRNVNAIANQNANLNTNSAANTNIVMNVNTTTNTNTSTVPANWQTYENTQYGYRFRYPADWTIVADTVMPAYRACLGSTGVQGIHVTDNAAGWPGSLEIAVANNPNNLTPSEWINTYPVMSGTNSNLISGVTDTTLGGQPAKEAAVFSFDQSNLVRLAVNGAHMTCVTQHDAVANDPMNAEHLATTAQILSTLQFID